MSKNQVTTILRECEEKLRELLQKTARQGDYECLLDLTNWTKRLCELIEDVDGAGDVHHGQGHTRTAPGSSPSGASNERRNRAVPTASASTTERSSAATARKGRASRKRSGRSAGYPKFGKHGDNLVKIGWSKKQKREYRHKAPQEVLRLMTAVLAEIGRAEQLVTTDDLLPIRSPDDRGDVPNYQSYLCLAWLRTEGLVLQEGRQGYRVPDPENLQDAAERLRRQLPVK